jgi:hypothetical protein
MNHNMPSKQMKTFRAQTIAGNNKCLRWDLEASMITRCIAVKSRINVSPKKLAARPCHNIIYLYWPVQKCSGRGEKT